MISNSFHQLTPVANLPIEIRFLEKQALTLSFIAEGANPIYGKGSLQYFPQQAHLILVCMLQVCLKL